MKAEIKIDGDIHITPETPAEAITLRHMLTDPCEKCKGSGLPIMVHGFPGDPGEKPHDTD